MKTETHNVKEIRIQTETIRERCSDYYKKELLNALDNLDYREIKSNVDKFISIMSREHETDLANHVVSETEVVLTQDQLDFLRNHKHSHVAVLNEDDEVIALFPHRDLTY